MDYLLFLPYPRLLLSIQRVLAIVNGLPSIFSDRHSLGRTCNRSGKCYNEAMTEIEELYEAMLKDKKEHPFRLPKREERPSHSELKGWQQLMDERLVKTRSWD